MPRRIRATPAPATVSRRLVMLFALLAFALQAYLIQTHIHGQPIAPMLGSHISAPAEPAPSDPLAPVNCALCQEILHAGAAITPDAIPLLLPLNVIAMATAVARLPSAALAPQTGWNSRAPPVR
jgi:hypothetical protein